MRPILSADEVLMSCEDFTGDKQAEKTLRESEVNFRTLAESSITGIFIVQGERFVYINPVFTEATGYTLKDLSSTNFWDIVSPGMREVMKARAAARQQARSTAPAQYELKVITKSGEEKLAHVDVTLIGFKGKPSILGTVTDLTERKLMEDALRASEEKYRAIFENAIEAIFQTTPDGRILSANPAMARIHGYDTPEELIRNVDDLAKIYVDPSCHACFRMLLGEEKEVRNFECEVYRKDGRKRWVSITARAVRDLKGTILHYEGTAEDITERRDAQEKLRESEEKFRLLFDKSADPIVLLDGETYVDCNEAAVRVLKCSSKDQVIGLHALALSPERQPDGRLSADEIRENIAVALREGRHRFERVRRGFDGEEFWVDVSLTAIPVRGRRILYSVWRDIGDRKGAEEALKEREKELERKSANLEEANAALKVLLRLREEDKKGVESAVLANIEKLVFPYLEKLKNMCVTDNQATFLSIIEQNLNHIISPFLQKMSSGYSHFTPTEIQIADLIKNGKTSKEIALCLNIGTATVHSHRNDIRSKLGLSNKKVNLMSYLLSFK
jgi:PAS domain S-box-containing protein